MICASTFPTLGDFCSSFFLDLTVDSDSWQLTVDSWQRVGGESCSWQCSWQMCTFCEHTVNQKYMLATSYCSTTSNQPSETCYAYLSSHVSKMNIHSTMSCWPSLLTCTLDLYTYCYLHSVQESFPTHQVCILAFVCHVCHVCHVVCQHVA